MTRLKEVAQAWIDTAKEHASAKIIDSVLSRVVKHGGLILEYADGTQRSFGPEGSTNPYLGVRINDVSALLRRAKKTRDPSLTVGDGYVCGEIDFFDPQNLVAQPPPIHRLSKLFTDNIGVINALPFSLERFRRTNEPNVTEAHREQIRRHYDISNEFFELWLGDMGPNNGLVYTCAIFDPPDCTLEQAQLNKIDLILDKTRLKAGQRLMDIGFGWGQLLIEAARYGIQGHGVTLSERQYEYASGLVKRLGLEELITLEYMDYEALLQREDLQEQFDVVVSVGFYEAVGKDNQDRYFEVLKHLLVPDGRSVLHTITRPRAKTTNAWIDRRIFPGGYIPADNAIRPLLRKHGFNFEHSEKFGPHYARTLQHWWLNFESHLDEVRRLFDQEKINVQGIDTADQFIRMWRLYLATAMGSFGEGQLDLTHYTFTKASQ